MKVPIATYRFQFNRGFRFADARTLVPYLQALGITDLYASPLFVARKGSTHGYDVTDPTCLNPELGTQDEFELLVKELKQHGMGLLLDIVPNHMAASPENPWWTDVLENGQSSPYASYFDIEWRAVKGKLEDKILLPILGGPYGSILENQELVLGLDEHGLYVRYYEVRLPVEPKSYRAVLSHRFSAFEERLGHSHEAVQGAATLMEEIEALPVATATDPKGMEERHRGTDHIKHRLWHLYNIYPEIKSFLDENIRIFNGAKKDPRSFDLLDQLLAEQAYRIAFWRRAAEHITYRRFFDISDLVSVRVEDPGVFEATHALIFELVKAGKVTGVRADHIDGLYDPLGYLFDLERRFGSPCYVLVEKILIGDETLPEDWPVCGTTGYDFLNALNGVFVDLKGVKRLDAIYNKFIRSTSIFSEVVYAQKKRVMEKLFPGEMDSLGLHLGVLAEQDRHARDLPPVTLSQALVEVTACFPIYRAYVRGFELRAQDRRHIERAVEEARRRNPSLDSPVFDFLRRLFLLDCPPGLTAEQKDEWLSFVRRWQQFTGPIMAKGLEDTSLYVYNRLVSLNEVGGDPGAQRLSVDAFHRHNVAMRARWPYTLNATSTHDTKRSEDVRARISVVSELPQAWTKCLNRWSRWNRAKKRQVDGEPVPDTNEEILLYQIMLGAWPLVTAEVSEFKERVKSYVIKAAKEAKIHTSWRNPNPEYERALMTFVDVILKASPQNKFLNDFLAFQKRIAFYGAFNALAQALLKIGSPGVPDFYQGTELWDFSLVDPDNRRPVDFTKRDRFLTDLKEGEAAGLPALLSRLLADWENGRIKLFVTAKALGFRRSNSELFLEGEYLPLSASGGNREHVCAFARRKGRTWALLVAPRLLTRLVAPGTLPQGHRVWKNARLVLPREAPEHWQNIFTAKAVRTTGALRRKILPLRSVLQDFPVALLYGVAS